MGRYRGLAITALLLLAFAAVALTSSGPGGQTLPMFGVLAVTVLLELPAVWWRMRGGTAMTTWGVAVGCPLLLFESLLALSAWKYRNAGGDLSGIEGMLGTLVIPPLVLVSGTIVAVLAIAFVRPGEQAD